MADPKEVSVMCASSGEERGDDREWELDPEMWHAYVPGGFKPRRAPDRQLIPIVPKSTLTAERHRADQAERERDAALDEITRTVNEYEKRTAAREQELERLREAAERLVSGSAHSILLPATSLETGELGPAGTCVRTGWVRRAQFEKAQTDMRALIAALAPPTDEGRG